MSAEPFRQTTGSLITISCGGGSKLVSDALSDASISTNIVAFDPVAFNLETLLPDDRALDQAVHIEGVPDIETGTTEAIVYSLPGLVGLSEPLPSLFDLFSGLRERRRVSISRIGVDELASRLGNLSAPIRCVIDLSGGEARALQALEKAKVLEKITRLELRCGIEPFFEGAQSSAEITTWLETRGFAAGMADHDDPDWPILQFTADPQARRVAELEDALQIASDRLKSNDAKLAEKDAVLKAVKGDVDRLKAHVSEQDAALTKAQASVTNKDQTIIDMEAKLAKTTAALEEKSAIITDQETALRSAKRDTETLRSYLAEKEEIIAALKREAASLGEAVTALRKTEGEIEDAQKAVAQRDSALRDMNEQISQLRAEMKQKNDQVTAAQAQYDRAVAEQGFQSRVNAMLQLDLDNLRQSFAESEDTRRTQEALLLKLTPKLAQAAEHLQRLQIIAPEEPPALEEETVPRSKTRSTRRKTPSKPRSKSKAKQGQ